LQSDGRVGSLRSLSRLPLNASIVGQTGMKRMTGRAVLGFAAAPVAPSALMWALEFRAEFTAWPAVLFGAGVAYAVTLVIGVPAYVLLTTHGRLRLVHTLAVSAIAGVIAMAIISEGRSLPAGGIGLLLGLSGGGTFWLIWRGGAAQQAVAADGTAARNSV
jgi:hypothetical protein